MTDKNTLKIVCEELVCIPSGAGVMQHVIFNPTEETLDAISDATKDDGEREYRTISVTDNGGEHSSKRMHRIVKFRKERNVVILTTLEG